MTQTAKASNSENLGVYRPLRFYFTKYFQSSRLIRYRLDSLECSITPYFHFMLDDQPLRKDDCVSLHKHQRLLYNSRNFTYLTGPLGPLRQVEPSVDVAIDDA